MFRSLFLFLRKINWLLVTPALVLTVFGLMMSFSLASAQQPADYSAFWKQVMFCGAGVVLLFVFASIDYRYFKSWSAGIYIAAVILMVAVLVFGATIRATRGWFVVFGNTIQVVEIAKVMLIITLSGYFARLQSALLLFRHVLGSAAAAGVLVVLTFLQPDFGSGLLLVGIYIGMMLLVRTRRSYLVLIALTFVAACVFSWFFILQDFQKERVLTFIDPSRDPLGVGYNLQQSTIAIGSGQWFGRGLTLGPQSRLNFLPERQNDFIFAVIGEALGFAGVLLLIALFGFLFYQMIKVARRCREDFGILLASGIALGLMIQTVVNISTNVGLLPIAGLPLPFVSAGGSSLIMSLISVGIVAGIDLRQRVGNLHE